MVRSCRNLLQFLPLAIVIVCSFAESQQLDLRGEIIDSLTLQPIPYANVVLEGESVGTAANASGFYVLAGIRPGSHRIVVTAVGYVRSDTTLSGVAGGSLRLDFRLAPTTLNLDEVVVTARGTESIPPPVAGLRHLEQTQLNAVPVPVQKDVVRSLLILPGVVSTSDVNSRFYVRGGGGDQNLMMLDGMRLYSPFHALGMYSVFDPDVIRSTDVYTGAFPAGFGGRLSSVVSLMTKEPRADKIAGGAEVNLLSSRMAIEGPVSPSSRIVIDARRSLFPDTFKRLSGIDRTFSFYDVFVKANTDVIGTNSLSGLVLLTGDDLRSQESASASYRWRNQLIGINSHGLVANRMYLMASLYVSRYSASRVPDSGSPLTPTSTSIVQPGLRIDATLYTSDVSTLHNFGFEFVFPRVNYKLINTAGAPRLYDASASEVAGWFRSQFMIAGMEMETGLHMEFMNIVQTGWKGIEPRIHCSRNLWGDWFLRLAYGRISQTIVTANNEDDLIPIFDAWIALPQKMPPEFADHYVAGLDGTVLQGLSAGLQVYRKQYRNLVLYNREKITLRDHDFLSGSGASSGVETLLRFSGGPFDVYGAYTFSHTEVSSAGLSYAPRYDIRHTINTLVQFRLSPAFDVSLRWEFRSGTPFTQTIGYYNRLTLGNPVFDSFENDPGEVYGILGAKNAGRMPAYHRLDLSVRYRVTIKSLSAEVGGSIVNVYNRKNIFYFERQTGKRVDMLPLFPSVYMSLTL